MKLKKARREAIPYAKTGTSDVAWDGGAQEKNLDNGDGGEEYQAAYAWQDPDGDPDAKASYKFIHHFVDVEGKVGDASTAACSGGIAALNGARGGADIPDEDRQDVYDHLAKHLEDAGLEAPELNSKRRTGLRPSAQRAVRDQVKAVLEGRPQERALAGSKLELREASDGSLSFNGYASVFNVEYDVWGGPPWGWTESVNEGAFTKTLSEGPDVRFLINHEGMPLARTTSGNLSLSEDNIGLLVRASLDASDLDVQRLAPKMRRRDINQMSFAFYTIRQEWDEDYVRRWLVELKLDDGDVSVVTYPASPSTSAELNNLTLLAERLSQEPARVLAEIRTGGKDPLQLVSRIRTGLTRVALATMKRGDGDADDDPAAIAGAIDAAIDGALEAWAEGNLDQAKALMQAAELASDALLALLGVADPDDVDDDARNARVRLVRRRLDSAGITKGGTPRLSLAKKQLELLKLR